ncbi:uncharacterized protein LOC102075991 isoform X1 [Oreochromis niloticus]|uniref:uncharacterized protein LOC102075991 isoform X1 n=1 Tax=Oreochromis niloticus TaxID=8128 RepID=UPI000674E159|nr:uncharacterized protein LOC102075991 isoform X1 [Oreochromis niloticus]CAI5673268.1 unnamed protein product [Mustela putorius furo]
MWVTLSCFDRCWTADTLVDELAIFLQDCPLSGVKTKTEKAGKMGTFDATRSVSSASTHLHHCHISWSQGCEVIQTSGPSAMFSKVPPDKPDLSLAVNVPQHVDGLLPVGPTPSAAVSTVKRKGQRGDIQFGVCFKPEAYRRLDVNLHHHRSILTQKWQQSGPSAALLLLPNRKPIEAQSAGLFQPWLQLFQRAWMHPHMKNGKRKVQRPGRQWSPFSPCRSLQHTSRLLNHVSYSNALDSNFIRCKMI